MEYNSGYTSQRRGNKDYSTIEYWFAPLSILATAVAAFALWTAGDQNMPKPVETKPAVESAEKPVKENGLVKVLQEFPFKIKIDNKTKN